MARDHDTEKTRTVLIVDDDGRVRSVLQTVVSALGYEAELASNGEEALACMARRRYDVVLCDVLMPSMGGDELFRVCQQEHPEMARRFAFMTCGSRALPAVAFVAATGQPFVSKPCRATEIQAAMDQVLGPAAATLAAPQCGALNNIIVHTSDEPESVAGELPPPPKTGHPVGKTSWIRRLWKGRGTDDGRA
jgi:DNA-binding NtrC family response regulator